jgi:hypothetical protein
MVTAGINAIVFGAMLLLLGMMPDVVAALREGLQNFRDHFFFTSSTYRNDLPRTGAVWLVVGGAMVILLGLLALIVG